MRTTKRGRGQAPGITRVARGRTVPSPIELRDTILAAWQTNARVTRLLVENLSPSLWSAAVPGAPRRTVCMIAGHVHNSRCMWIKTLGKPLGLQVPASVDRRAVTQRQLLAALGRSAQGIQSLLVMGCEAGGQLPATAAYTWRNLALDVGHLLTYFVAHEGHHRGQIILIARQLGQPLPRSVTIGMWQWRPQVTRRPRRRR